MKPSVFSFCIAFTILLTSAVYTVSAADVEQYGVIKGQVFSQTSSASPVMGDPGFVFQAFADGNENDDEESLTGVTLRLPDNTLIPIPDDDGFELGESFSSQSALDTAFPDGNYALITEGVNDGLRTNVLSLTGSDYPGTPHFSNFAAAQSVDAAAEFILSWNPVPGATSNDVIFVSIKSCGDDGDDVFGTPDPGEPGALDGLATSVTIPARSLRPGQTYNIELVMARLIMDDASYPDASGLSGFFKQVQMPLTTTGEQTGCAEGHFNLAFNFQHGSFGTGTNGIIQFPQGISYYFVNFGISDSDYPETVTFSGPLGSGLNNTTNGSSGSSSDSAFYGSPSIDMPPFPPGGVYTVRYKETDLKWNLLDPDAANQQVIIVPSVVVDASNVLQQINWTYKDTSGNSIPAQPFMTSIGLNIEATGGRYDVHSGGDQGITPDQTNHVLTSTVIWTNVSMVFLHFQDPAGNSYWSYWQRSSIPPEITTTNLPIGSVGTPYSFLLNALGGTHQFTWSIESGSLPDGLSLTGATGEILGTPTEAGTNDFVIRVTDTASSTATQAVSIVIHAGSVQGGFQLAFNFEHGSFGAGTNGIIAFPQELRYYFVNFSINDFDYPETVTFSGPAGSGLTNTMNATAGSSSNSAFYGSPSINMPPFPPGGVYTVNYKGSDLEWNLLEPNAANQQVLIVPSVVVDASNVLQQINWTYKDINGNSIPLQPFMTSIGLTVEAVGGRYDVFSGHDSGITLDQTNHVLTSTVIWTNVGMVFMHFQDPAGNSYSSFWSRSSIPPEITTTNLPSGTVGTPYSFLFHASGGTGQFAWTIESGSLPDGLSLTEAIGEIVGTPTQAGTNEVVIRVTDTASSHTNRTFSLVIHPGSGAPSFSSANRLLNGDFEMLLSGEVGKTYRIDGSTNLIQWDELLTTGSNPTNGTVYFRDTGAPGLGRRFYRALLIP